MNKKTKDKIYSSIIIPMSVLAGFGLLVIILAIHEYINGYLFETEENEIVVKNEEKITTNDTNITYDGVIYDVDNNLYSHDRFNSYNEKIDFDILKSLLSDEKNIVYSPLSIKESLFVLSRITGNDTHDQIYNLYPVNRFPLTIESDDIKISETGIFLKNEENNDLNEKVENYLKYSNISYSVVSADNLSPKIINDWVKRVTLDKIKQIYNDDEDLSGNSVIVSSITAIDMLWGNKIAGGMNLNISHENFSCKTYQFDKVGYKHLLFNETLDTSGLEFAAAGNKYDIINELGYDNIKNVVYEAYTDWLNESEWKDEYADTTDKYIEQYMEEISHNYGQYDASTDFKYFVNDDIKVFYKSLKQYDNIELEYIGIMPNNEKLNEFVKKVDGNYLNNVLSNLKGVNYYDLEEGYCTKIHGVIPVFDYKNSNTLKEQLKSFGIEDVFDSSKSDFSPITNNLIYLDNIINDTEISFSNEGIKAISYTVCDGLGQGGPDFDYLFDVPVIDIDLTFDKPFIYFIRDKRTNQIFFSGAVYEPHKFVDS